MIAAGIDLGGTKIEAQLFAPDWSVAERRRTETPKDYPALVEAVADAVRWCRAQAGAVPVGISAAGLVNPASGIALTANLCATGHPFPADIAQAVGGPVTYLNDCRAMTLSEAKFGAGRGARAVAGVVLGTGVGGGFAHDGKLAAEHSGLGGEFGHMAAPAGLVAEHGLPVLRCGCGRMGCIETLVAGPGLTRIAEAVGAGPLAPPEIAARRGEGGAVARAWAIWAELVAELVMSLSLSLDPDVVVLGGGLSRIEGVTADIEAALTGRGFEGYARPRLALAEGGDASGARGAAYAALQASGAAT